MHQIRWQIGSPLGQQPHPRRHHPRGGPRRRERLRRRRRARLQPDPRPGDWRLRLPPVRLRLKLRDCPGGRRLRCQRQRLPRRERSHGHGGLRRGPDRRHQERHPHLRRGLTVQPRQGLAGQRAGRAGPRHRRRPQLQLGRRLLHTHRHCADVVAGRPRRDIDRQPRRAVAPQRLLPGPPPRGAGHCLRDTRLRRRRRNRVRCHASALQRRGRCVLRQR